MSDPKNYQEVLGAGAVPPADPTEAQAHAGVVRVEVVPDPALAGTLGPADLLERFTDRVEELGTAICGIAEKLRVSLETKLVDEEANRWGMSQVSMEFGLNLEASTGVVVVKGKAVAAFKVTITWTPKDSSGT
ncbi:CU044_2847 family protein [Lentzea sp. BCCO 10_0061]|uniref:CU044_2847 family protein n=1 Tax=Lentzea sokolovensis TaxID=3095429 RepID=A0ABU4VCL5_9PSEU|nr:CU044_2847 family protein [Lentzea sp. BCCO 10_0061]MDX8149514.1 CU044_2847 family protein [Lentzea sp. BCCO 10_0061]